MRRIDFRAMGSRMHALVAGDPSAADELDDLPQWFEEWEQALSRFRPESELSRLNRGPGEWRRVSTVLWHVLQAALAAAKQSGGLVVPTLLDALEAAGYDRSFETLDTLNIVPASLRQLERRRDGDGIDSWPPDWRGIECHAPTRSVRLPAGLHLDLGGIAKGWAADRAARRLAAHDGPALVNAGGDIAVSGPQPDGAAWPIGVTDPFDPDGQIELLQIVRGGVATSGRDYHHWTQGGVERHHILDPRTGLPAASDVLAATAIAPSAEQAEVAAKTALILGSRHGLAWIDARPSFAALLVLEDGQRRYSQRIYHHLYPR